MTNTQPLNVDRVEILALSEMSMTLRDRSQSSPPSLEPVLQMFKRYVPWMPEWFDIQLLTMCVKFMMGGVSAEDLKRRIAEVSAPPPPPEPILVASDANGQTSPATELEEPSIPFFRPIVEIAANVHSLNQRLYFSHPEGGWYPSIHGAINIQWEVDPTEIEGGYQRLVATVFSDPDSKKRP